MEKYFRWQNFFFSLLDIIGISVFNTKWIVHIQKYYKLISLHDCKDIIAQYSAVTKTGESLFMVMEIM